jgi:hypothetical protein
MWVLLALLGKLIGVHVAIEEITMDRIALERMFKIQKSPEMLHAVIRGFERLQNSTNRSLKNGYITPATATLTAQRITAARRVVNSLVHTGRSRIVVDPTVIFLRSLVFGTLIWIAFNSNAPSWWTIGAFAVILLALIAIACVLMGFQKGSVNWIGYEVVQKTRRPIELDC